MSLSKIATFCLMALLMASPSEMTLVVIGSAASVAVISPATASFWQIVTAMGLTLTPLLGRLGKVVAHRMEGDEEGFELLPGPTEQKVVVVGFGRVGRMVACGGRRRIGAGF